MLWSSLETKKLQTKPSLLEYITGVFSSHVIVAFRIKIMVRNVKDVSKQLSRKEALKQALAF